jgi:hypothetical protein
MELVQQTKEQQLEEACVSPVELRWVWAKIHPGMGPRFARRTMLWLEDVWVSSAVVWVSSAVVPQWVQAEICLGARQEVELWEMMVTPRQMLPVGREVSTAGLDFRQIPHIC